MRVFTAIEFERETKEIFANYAAECRKRGVRGKFTLRDNFHMTLHFLGEQDNNRVKDILDAMKRTAKKINCFTLRCKTTGIFQSDGGYLFWTGTETNSECEKLYILLGEELEKLGFQTEKRQFRPHITVARNVHTDISLFPDFPETDIKVCGITLFESKRVDGKLIYEPIGYSKFGK